MAGMGYITLEVEKYSINCVAHFVHSFNTNDLYSRLGHIGGMPSCGSLGHACVIHDLSTVLLDFQ